MANDADVDPHAFKRWTPAAQERALAELQRRTQRPWHPFYCGNRNCNGKPHDQWDFQHARGDQYPPPGNDWLTWLNQSGRGGGKTRSGAEYTHRAARKIGRIAILAGTSFDIRETLLEGESGLLTIAAPDFRPFHEPSKRRITWPNGAVGQLLSAEEPDRVRGPEFGYAWLDEAAHWPLVQDCWDNLMFGLRIGKRPHVMITTTPKQRPWLKNLRADPTTRIATVSTYDNLDNLAPAFAELVISRYEGTRLGRQELYGEMLEDVEGALWNSELIETDRVGDAPILVRTVIGVDPAGSSRATADETGIVVAGRDMTGELYVIADLSGRYTPHGWASTIIAAVERFSADAVVAETNFGGDMVDHTLRAEGFDGRLIKIHARKAKDVRAEPVVGLYEQHKVHHVGVFDELEAEQVSWVPYSGDPSPNRLDAAVYALTQLSARARPAQVATPATLRHRPRQQPIAWPASPATPSS